MNESLNLEIWDRLVHNKPLDGLPLDVTNERIDLRGLELPEPSVGRRFEFEGVPIVEIESGAIIRGAKWQNLDFSNGKLNGLRLFDCSIDNCQFDHCQLQDLRVWSTTVIGCSFKMTNLRKSALGGVQNGKRNVYSGVDFSGADLRETVYKAAAFERCVFRDAKIVKIDFQTSTFTDCLFEGELHDVLFYRRGFEGDAFPANEMINVDFSHAKLHDVGFRGLTLDRVKLPEDSDHIVIKDVAATLEKLIVALKRQGDATAKKLTVFLNIDRKWIAPNQKQGVINIEDLAETVGAEGVDRLRELLQR